MGLNLQAGQIDFIVHQYMAIYMALLNAFIVNITSNWGNWEYDGILSTAFFLLEYLY